MKNLTPETQKFFCSCQITPIKLSELKCHIKNIPKDHIIQKVENQGKKFKNQKKIVKRMKLIKSLKMYLAINFIVKSIFTYDNSANQLYLKRCINKIYESNLSNSTTLNLSKSKISKKNLINQILKILLIPNIKEITVFKHSKQKYKRKFKHFFQNRTNTIRSLYLSQDSLILISGGDDGRVRVWNSQTLQQIACLSYHKSPIMALDIDESSNFLLSGSFDHSIGLWSIKNKKLKNVFQGHQNRVYSLKFAPNSAVFLSGSDDKTIRIWKTHEPSLLYLIETNSEVRFISIAQVTFGSIGVKIPLILFVTLNGKIVKIDLNSSRFLVKKDLRNNVSFSVIAEENGILMTGHYDGWLQFIDLKDLSLLKNTKAHSAQVNLIDFCQNIQRFITCSDDYSIKLWSSKTYTLKKSLNHFIYPIFCVQISDDKIYFGGKNCQIELLNNGTKRTINLRKIKNFCLAVSIKLNLIAYGFEKVSLFCLKSLRDLNSIQFNCEVTSISFTKSIILCGTEKGDIFMVDSKDLGIKRRYFFEKIQILFVLASKNLKLMCFSTENKSELIEILSGKVILSLSDRIISGKFSSNCFVFVDAKTNINVYDYFRSVVKVCTIISNQIYFFSSRKFFFIKTIDSMFCLVDSSTAMFIRVFKSVKEACSYLNKKEFMVIKEDSILLSLDYSIELNS